ASPGATGPGAVRARGKTRPIVAVAALRTTDFGPGTGIASQGTAASAQQRPLRRAEELAEVVNLVPVRRVAPTGELRIGRRVLLGADVGVEVVERPQVDDFCAVAQCDEV